MGLVGMSQVVSALLRTVGGIIESSLWNLMGCPKLS